MCRKFLEAIPEPRNVPGFLGTISVFGSLWDIFYFSRVQVFIPALFGVYLGMHTIILGNYTSR